MNIQTPISPQALLNDIYRQKTVSTADGEVLPLNSEVSPEEGRFLFDIIRSDAAVTRTLEVGCAYGISSLNICAALQGRDGATHTILDPFQSTWWKSVGIANLRRAGLNNFRMVEERSEVALPKILAESEGQFDFIFLDGWHTFDQTMLDCFYSARLLKVGGYLVLDDAHWRGVTKVIRYLERYPCFERHGSVKVPEDHFGTAARAVRAVFTLAPLRSIVPRLSYPLQAALGDRHSMVALRKISADERSFDWFAEF